MIKSIKIIKIIKMMIIVIKIILAISNDNYLISLKIYLSQFHHI